MPILTRMPAASRLNLVFAIGIGRDRRMGLACRFYMTCAAATYRPINRWRFMSSPMVFWNSVRRQIVNP